MAMAALAVGGVSLAHAAMRPAQSVNLPDALSSSQGLLTADLAADLAAGDQGSGLLTSRYSAGPSAADAFGRDFTADLNGLLWSDSFQTATPFSSAVQTPLGRIMASGFAVRSNVPFSSAPELFGSQLTGSGREPVALRDVRVSDTVMPGVTINMGYNARMAGNLSGSDAAGSPAYDGLFFSASAVNSPYTGLANGGSYLSASVQLTEGLAVQFGAASRGTQQVEFAVPVFSTLDQMQGVPGASGYQQVQSSEAGLSWNFAKWGGLGLTASNTSESGGILGTSADDALSPVRSADTTAIGLTAHFGFGQGWVTSFAYNEGFTQLNLRPGTTGDSTGTLHSRSYGLAVAKRGLFGKSDLLGVALTRPIHIFDGGLNFLPGVDSNGNLVVPSPQVSLAGAAPETDVELGYTTNFFDGALALQANAGYQINFAGKSGTNAVTVLSRAKINF